MQGEYRRSTGILEVPQWSENQDLSQLDEEQLGHFFEEFMEEMGIPQKARDNMRAQPNQSKIMMMQAEQEKLRQKSLKNTEYRYYFEMLASDRMSSRHLRLLRVAIREASKTWLTGFIDKCGSLPFLLNQLPKSRIELHKSEAWEVCLETLNCIKELLKNDYSMKAVLNTNGFIDQVALLLLMKGSYMEQLETDERMADRIETVSQSVYDVLTMTCWADEAEEGLKVVTAALSNSQFRRGIQVVLDDFELSNNVEIKNGAIQLINALISGREDLDDRSIVRNHVKDRGIIKSMERVRDWCEEMLVFADIAVKTNKRGSRVSISEIKKLVSHMDLFDDEMAADEEDILARGLENGDLDVVWDALKEMVAESGNTESLADLIRSLKTIPSEDGVFSARKWQNVLNIAKAVNTFTQTQYRNASLYFRAGGLAVPL